jgi:plasmid stabilization system protein ParE
MAARATANFERNLEDIRAFLSDAGAAHEFERLIAHLSDDIIPTLERFPDLGSEFLVRSPLSAKGRALFERVARLAGSKLSVRQLVDDDYIILYAVQSETIVLLSIRHQRQLSFDFGGHWP